MVLAVPVGHRNNQIHVYDAWGIYFYEHHYTRRVPGCAIIFRPDEHKFRFTPEQPFSGGISLANYIVLPPYELVPFLKLAPFASNGFSDGSAPGRANFP